MEIKNLYYRHDKSFPDFFENLNFKLNPGKLNALHGKNGMGKSVLLNILSRNTPPESITRGEIKFCKPAILVNQRFDEMIADQFSFEENLKFARMKSYPSFLKRLETKYYLPDFLDKFNIDRKKSVKKLSGGQRQILALLMILQKQRDFLLLDEPTATLDEENARIVFEFLQTLTLQNVTLLIVCHDRQLLNEYTNGAKLCLELKQGKRTITVHE